jgi:hypothetical protein
MTPPEAFAVIRRLSLPPGWSISAAGERDGFFSIKIAIAVLDATKTRAPHLTACDDAWSGVELAVALPQPHENLIRIQQGATLNMRDLARMREEDLLTRVRRVMYELSNHEIDEWLKLDGAPLRDPHPEQAIGAG